MSEPTGWVFDLQRGAMHDGPGIRTSIFLQGCPLRCAWCHNPESWAMPPARARAMTVSEAMAEVLRDRDFYAASGGGLTLSGGEPCVQFEFGSALLQAAKSAGIHTCLDTSGAFPLARLDLLLPWVDLWLLDVKVSDEHKRLTGVTEGALERVRGALLDSGAQVRLRCPLVPGVNDSPRHLRQIAALSCRAQATDLMPYHRVGVHKYAAQALTYPLEGVPEPDAATREGWLRALNAMGAQRVGWG